MFTSMNKNSTLKCSLMITCDIILGQQLNSFVNPILITWLWSTYEWFSGMFQQYPVCWSHLPSPISRSHIFDRSTMVRFKSESYSWNVIVLTIQPCAYSIKWVLRKRQNEKKYRKIANKKKRKKWLDVQERE